MKVIVLGANSKATDNQCKAAFKIGTVLVENDYVCIHGAGTGTMLNTTLGMQSKDKDKADRLTYTIWPESMKLESKKTRNYYKSAFKKVVVPTIHDRIGLLLKESETANFIICYGGGIGTTHELFSILTNYYDKVHLMPCILFCDVDAQNLIEKLYSLLNSWDIPERPYIKQLIKKIKVYKVDEICRILKSKTKRKNNLIY